MTALLTLEIERLIDDAALALLKPEAGFIKFARASIVDYNALRRRPTDGQLRGVVLMCSTQICCRQIRRWAAPNVISNCGFFRRRGQLRPPHNRISSSRTSQAARRKNTFCNIALTKNCDIERHGNCSH